MSSHVFSLASRLKALKKKGHPWPASCNHGNRKCSPITSVDRAWGKRTVSWCFQWLPPIGVSTSFSSWSWKATKVFHEPFCLLLLVFCYSYYFYSKSWVSANLFIKKRNCITCIGSQTEVCLWFCFRVASRNLINTAKKMTVLSFE